MNDILINILTFLMIIIMLIGAFFTGYIYKTYTFEKETPSAQIATSGDTTIIQHSNIKQTKKETTFETTSTGSGKITTTIKNPGFYNHSILIDYSIKNKIGVQYLYRYDRFLIGGGINTNPDIFVSAGIMF